MCSSRFLLPHRFFSSIIQWHSFLFDSNEKLSLLTEKSYFSIQQVLPFSGILYSTAWRHSTVLNTIIFTATRQKKEQKSILRHWGRKVNHRNVATWEASNRSFGLRKLWFGVEWINSSFIWVKNWQVVIHLQLKSFLSPCLHWNYRRPNPRKINLRTQFQKEGKLNNEFMKNASCEGNKFLMSTGWRRRIKIKRPGNVSNVESSEKSWKLLELKIFVIESWKG